MSVIPPRFYSEFWGLNEKTMKKISSIAIILSFCFPVALFAQKPNKLGSIAQSVSTYTQKKAQLSSEKLSKATLIIYHSGNGSVAPECHYDCYIHVLKNSVSVTIYGGNDGAVKYNESSYISTADYKKFLNSLLKQGIRKTPSNGNEFLCGAGASDITVKTKQQVIFSGDEYVDISINKGGLIDSFLPLLSDDMLEAVRNPDSKITPMEIIPEIDIDIP